MTSLKLKPIRGLDVDRDTTGRAHELAAAQVQAVQLYLRPDRSSAPMVKGLHEMGIRIVSLFEKGEPTNPGYFTVSHGTIDGKLAIAMAGHLGQPTIPNPACQIFFAVDYDATIEEIQGPVRAYFAELQRIVKPAGYLVSVYGSGRVCADLIHKGLAHSGMLAQSRKWAGYDWFKDYAVIIQGPQATLLGGLDVDWPNIIVDPSVCW